MLHELTGLKSLNLVTLSTLGMSVMRVWLMCRIVEMSIISSPCGPHLCMICPKSQTINIPLHWFHWWLWLPTGETHTVIIQNKGEFPTTKICIHHFPTVTYNWHTSAFESAPYKGSMLVYETRVKIDNWIYYTIFI